MRRLGQAALLPALLLTIAAAPSCRRAAPAAGAPAAPVAPTAGATTAPVEPIATRAEPVPPPAPPQAVSETVDTPEETEALVGEERDRDPRSRTVTIKLTADPRRKARVFWGRKDLGFAPLEITRPRDSGPLDLVVTAPGCLTFHTRAFTDRDDKIALRLYGEREAPALLGYRPSPER